MATTRIECTKDEFKAALIAEFGPLWENLPQRDNAEFQAVIDGLVTQANNTRGTFRGYNAYLDLEFEVGGIRVEDEITIPAVTEVPRAWFNDHSGEIIPAENLDSVITKYNLRMIKHEDSRITLLDDTNGCDWGVFELRDDPTEGITIPAVTKAQAAQGYTAAATTTSQVASYLLILTRNGELSAKALAGEIGKLMAAAGHLALAEQYEADVPKADLAAEHMAKGGQLNGGIGHWSNH